MPPALPPRIAMRLRVDVAPRRQVQRRIEAVLGVGHAPPAPQGAAVGPPVPRAARVVDAGHGEAAGREELHGEVEPGLARRRRPAVAPRHAAAARAGRAAGATQRRAVERAVHRTPRAPGQGEGLPARHVGRPEHDRRPAGAGASAPRPRAHTQTFDGASGVLPMSASPPACAHSALTETHGCRSGGAGGTPTGPRGASATSVSRPDAVMRATTVPSASSAMVDCPSTQSGPWNSAATSAERARLLARVGLPRVDIGLPPAPPVRDEAQRTVAPPRRLADRLLGPARHRPRRARRRQQCRPVGRSGDHGERQHHEHRGVPGHVGVIPHDHGQAVAVRMDAGGSRRSRARERAWTRSAAAPRVDSATMLRLGPAPPSRWTSRTARTQSPSAVALSPPWLCTSPAGGAADRGRGVAAPRLRPPGRRRTTPAGRPGRRRRTRRPPAPAPGTWLRRRTRGPGCGCSPRRRVVGEAVRPGPHHDHAAGLGRAATRASRAPRRRSRARRATPWPGRRRPPPAARPNARSLPSWPRSERTRCTGRRPGTPTTPSTVSRCASRPTCSRRRAR